MWQGVANFWRGTNGFVNWEVPGRVQRGSFARESQADVIGLRIDQQMSLIQESLVQINSLEDSQPVSSSKDVIDWREFGSNGFIHGRGFRRAQRS